MLFPHYTTYNRYGHFHLCICCADTTCMVCPSFVLISTSIAISLSSLSLSLSLSLFSLCLAICIRISPHILQFVPPAGQSVSLSLVSLILSLSLSLSVFFFFLLCNYQNWNASLKKRMYIMAVCWKILFEVNNKNH